MQDEVVIGRADVEKLHSDIAEYKDRYGESRIEPYLFVILADVRKIRLILERTNNVRVDHG